MRGEFFAGLALGAMLGAIILEASPETKKIVQRGQHMLEEKMDMASKQAKQKTK